MRQSEAKAAVRRAWEARVGRGDNPGFNAVWGVVDQLLKDARRYGAQELEDVTKRNREKAARLAVLMWHDCGLAEGEERGASHCQFEGTHVCTVCTLADARADRAELREALEQSVNCMATLALMLDQHDPAALSSLALSPFVGLGARNAALLARTSDSAGSPRTSETKRHDPGGR